MTAPDLQRLKIDRTAAPLSRTRRRPWWLVGGVLLAVVVGVVVFARPRETAVEVTTLTTAYPYQNLTVLSAAGYVVAQRKASVSSKATGRLEWLGVQDGSVVKENQVIARLDARDVRAQADQAQANVAVARAMIGQADAELTDAQATLNRTRNLRAQNFVSESTLDTVAARFNKARAGVASAQASLIAAQANARAAEVAVEQTLIRAPFDGVVLTKNANVGDIITPFSSAAESKGAVVNMADMRTLEVEADVSESSLSKITVGQPCEIQLDALPDERFRGRVSRLVPTVDRTKATVMTKVELVDRDPRILPDMAAKVVFLSGPVEASERTPRVVVNPDAIAQRRDLSVVFALSGTQVRQVAVTRGERIADSVAITPLKAGERVVLRPDDALGDGARVKITQKQP